jgi:hypothetical protein
VLVDAGEHRGDVAVWKQRGLVIRAFRGAASSGRNGAGIRLDVDSRLSVHRCRLLSCGDFADAPRLDLRLRTSSKLVSSFSLEGYSPLSALSPGAFQRLAAK